MNEMIDPKVIGSDIINPEIIGLEINSSDRINELIDFETMRLNIRKGYYPYLGAGSGRIVYDLGNGYVVKVSKNSKCPVGACDAV